MPITRDEGLAHIHLAEPHWPAIWESSVNGNPVFSYWLTDPSGEPASIIRIFERAITCAHAKINCWGIGGVFTKKCHRGLNYATRLLEHFIKEAPPTRPMALLIGSPEKTLYTRLGFHPIRTHVNTLYLNLQPGIEVDFGHYWRLQPPMRF